MVFQQRNGRVDRYGQTQQPRIVYLFTETGVERIKGDLRILEILQTKDEQANKNLGDPASFLHVFDPEKEAAKVADIMAEGTSPQQFEATIDAAQASTEQPEAGSDDDGDWLLKLFAQSAAGRRRGRTTQAQHSISFATAYPCSALPNSAATTPSPKRPCSSFRNPTPIASFTPRRRQPDHYAERPARLAGALARHLADGSPRRQPSLCPVRSQGPHGPSHRASPPGQGRAKKAGRTLHYLWPQHPIMEWLSDRVLTAFGRHRAPVIQCPQLIDGEQAFMLMGLIPNRKGQPLLIEWQVAVFNAGAWSLQAFPDFVARTKLKAGSLANRNQGIDTAALQANLPGAVAAMRQHMVSLQGSFAADMTARLAGTLADLERLQGKQFAQLELRLAANQQAEQFKKTKREQRTQHIRKVFDEYRQWVQDTMTTEPQPFIQVLAAAVR